MSLLRLTHVSRDGLECGRSKTRLLCACLTGLFLAAPAACDDDAGNGFTPKPKQTAAPAADDDAPSLPDEPAATTWSYSPVGKRDPFRSYLADMAEHQEKEKDNARPDDAVAFEMDQYKLSGLVTSTAQPRAMVEDPDGNGHVLKIGSRLGKNGGRVTRITNDGIVVTEEFRAPTGERIRVPITIKLPRPDVGILE